MECQHWNHFHFKPSRSHTHTKFQSEFSDKIKKYHKILIYEENLKHLCKKTSIKSN